MVPVQFRTSALTVLAVIALVYSAYLTSSNLAHIRAMPNVEREPLSTLSLPAEVRIVESLGHTPSEQSEAALAPHNRHDDQLVRRDVHVQIGTSVYPASRRAWVRLDRSEDDPLRYLSRFRSGLLNNGTDLQMYLVEVTRTFGDVGDAPRVNLWRFNVTRHANTSLALDESGRVEFAHDISLSNAQASDTWRPLFADSYRRLVRAFPALAAFVVALAAIGSLAFALWRSQPWAVVATTITFVLPIVSAAPFLTAFGWLPLVAAVVLGFVLTTAIVCAIEQRALAGMLAVVRARWLSRVLEALAIPLAALVVGTTLVTSLASVSVIEWQGLGSASPGEIFMASLIRPAFGLFVGGLGVCVLLAVFYGVLCWRRNTQA